MSHIHHAMDYIEFSVTDMAKAKKFYSAAFEWTFNDYAPGYAGIVRVQGSGEAGGLSLVEHKVESNSPLVVLYSQKIESSLQAVIDAGGEITKPIFEFPGGRRFEFKDPSGNSLAVWQEL